MKSKIVLIPPGTPKKDMKGMEFGRLKVGECAGRNSKGAHFWNCHCVCGGSVVVQGFQLVCGRTTSCGCARSDANRRNKFKHGGRKGPDAIRKRLYTKWHGMKKRCGNPNNNEFKNYGGRGIRVCDRWKDFTLFCEDMQSTFKMGLTIERVDVNGHYEPSNCVWIPREEQAKNTRSNIRITFNGKTQCCAQWARETGISAYKISRRLKKGLPIEKVLS